jgi:hypothetical protein
MKPNLRTKHSGLWVLALALLSLQLACDMEGKDPIVNPKVDGLAIDSFQVSTNLIKSWYDTAQIKVFVTGMNYSIYWECDHGVLEGEGDQVSYHAGECCVGMNTISCTVKDSTRTVMDTVRIYVKSILEP